MSNETAKYINSRRRHKNDVAIARQVRIAKAHGLGFHDKAIKEPKKSVRNTAGIVIAAVFQKYKGRSMREIACV